MNYLFARRKHPDRSDFLRAQPVLVRGLHQPRQRRRRHGDLAREKDVAHKAGPVEDEPGEI
jgi:hypothetical protein